MNIPRTKVLELEQYRPEIQEQLNLELQSIREGNLDDALLIKAMAHNWSFPHFLKVARWRGKSWRFLSALSDAALELQGIAMLRLMAHVMGNNLMKASMKKTMETIQHLYSLLEQHTDNPHMTKAITTALEQVLLAQQETLEAYWNDVRKIRG